MDSSDHGRSYAQAALDRECESLARLGSGRNPGLNSAAFNLGQLIGSGLLEEQEVERRLIDASTANGYIAKDGLPATRSTIRSGIEKGRAEPRSVPEPTGRTNGYHAPQPARREKPGHAPAKPSPRLSGVPIPDWTPDTAKHPFTAVGASEPAAVHGELRRHVYRRDGEPVRVKVKRGPGSFVDFYRVRHPEDGAVGWQAKKPAGFVPALYVSQEGDDPFSPDLAREAVFWPEGEKDVDTLARHGFLAFTFGGSSDVPNGAADLVAGREVLVLSDNDEAGLKGRDRKVAALAGHAARTRVIDFPDLPEGNDVSDWFEARYRGDPQELWELAIDASVPAETGPATPIRATPFRWVDPRTIPPREWIYGWHYVRRFVSATISPGGIGKSSLAIVEALAIATGLPLLGIKPADPTKVWIWNGEDPQEELERRVMAAALHYGLSASDLDGRLFVDSGRRQPMIIAEQTKDGTKVAVPIVQAVKRTIVENGIGVFVVDPFISSHRVTENDNNAIEAVATAFAGIADETDCAIELIHHARKTAGGEITVDDGRGASGLVNKARCARALNAMSEEEADEAGVENRRLHFRYFDGKANLAPPAEGSTWLKLTSVDLGNATAARPSDSVGVVTAWAWPDAMSGVTLADLRLVQQKVAAGSYRENVQAGDWIGHVIAEVLHLDLAIEKDKKRVKSAFKAWIRSGALKVVLKPDRKGEMRPFVEVGEWV